MARLMDSGPRPKAGDVFDGDRRRMDRHKEPESNEPAIGRDGPPAKFLGRSELCRFSVSMLRAFAELQAAMFASWQSAVSASLSGGEK